MNRSSRQPSQTNTTTITKQTSGATLPQAQTLLNSNRSPKNRSPLKNKDFNAQSTGVSGLKSAKAADATKFTFLPIKDTMDEALLEEITQLKKANDVLVERYEGHNQNLTEENGKLRENITSLKVVIDQDIAKKTTEF